MELIFVVRKYGLVGGMERYVWELSNELSKLGFKITILCEKSFPPFNSNIRVIELGRVQPKPRWLSSFIFSFRVAKWLKKNPVKYRLIHSNERLYQHHITTVHGSPFSTIFEKPWWRLISLRVWMQLYLEKRELATAEFIIPVSGFIKKQLTYHYPEFVHKLTEPIVPGVEVYKQPIKKTVPKDGGVVAFIGREWKRKGLKFATDIIKDLRATRPNLMFHIIGPDPNEIKHLFQDWNGGVQLMGWCSQENYGQYDVLLHPATSEPYGMVISESLAIGIPVVISDVCGAAQDVTDASGKVLSTQSSIEEWSEAVDQQLSRATPIPIFKRSWSQVANEHVMIYEKCIKTVRMLN